MRTFVISAALLAIAACSQETRETPDTTADIDSTAPTTTTTPPASPSMSAMIETDARSRIEAAGYTNITGLTQSPDGTWTATATRDGQTTQVVVDQTGVRVATTTTP
jgi:hypothetical protein